MHGRRGMGRAVVGIAISVIALLLVFRTVDVAARWQIIKGAQPQWIVLMVAFIIFDVLLRALRWRVLLAPIAKVPYLTTLSSLLVGYLANNILPARLGEVIRSHDLGTRTGLSRTMILGTIVVERVVDTVVVVAIASVAILVLSVRGIVASAVLVGLAVTALLVVAIGLGIAAHRLPGAERASAFLGRWPRIRLMLARLRDGLSVAKEPRTMGAAVVLSVITWSCTVLAFAAAAQAVGVQPTIGQAALLAAGVNLATAIPSAPGYVGTFELAAVTIAASVGIGSEDALALAVLVHMTALLVTSIGGALAFAQGQRDAKRRQAAAPVGAGESAADEPPGDSTGLDTSPMTTEAM